MTAPAAPRFRLARRKVANGLMWAFVVLAMILAVLPLALVLIYVVAQGASAVNWDFFTKLPKPVGEAGGGAANALLGSLILVGLASAVGLPVGILGGTYLAEFGDNRFAFSVRFAADVLAGVPAIVIGIFIWAVMVVPMHGNSALAGGVALGVMMVPIIMRTTEELVRLVPRSLRDGSLALGASHWRTTLSIVLPAARGGMITGILLAIARIAGEAAPLLFTAGWSSYWSAGLAGQPVPSLPVLIFQYASSPYDGWHRLAWGSALVLVVLMFVLSAAARYVTRGKLRLVR
jgi:phosphate transport system permease protein